MICSFILAGKNWSANLNKPIEIGIPLKAGTNNPRAWYCEEVSMSPVKMDGFIGEVAKGGSVNFRNITFNPHGHGTHTESYGHISPDIFPVNKALRKFHFSAYLYSLPVHTTENGDRIIRTQDLLNAHPENMPWPEACLIRSLPNNNTKLTQVYTESNPPYLETSLLKLLADKNVEHLLLDLPSVDREVDGGALAGHKAFWNYPENPRKLATITELAFFPDTIPDGWYLLNLQTANFENDATPSRPVIYELSCDHK
jgi:arylformamidase